MGFIKRVAVIGSGTMGHSMAQNFASAGYRVNLHDINAQALSRAIEQIESHLDTMQKIGLIKEEISRILSRISCETELDKALEGVDFVAENISEDLYLKQEFFKKLDSMTPPHVILASNTSSLKLSDIVRDVKNKNRVILAHWFNPPHVVPLVELCGVEETSAQTFEAVRIFLEECGKVTIYVKKEVPGLVANRLQIALAREAFHLYQEDIASTEDIDKAVMFGPGLRLPIGGFYSIADLGGLDIWNAVYNYLVPHLNSEAVPIQTLQEKVQRGDLGVKTGRGFYEYPEKPEFYAKQRDIKILKMLQELK